MIEETQESEVASERLAFSVDEAAKLLAVSRDLIYDLVRQGQLPAVRLGRRIVVTRTALRALLDKNTESIYWEDVPEPN